MTTRHIACLSTDLAKFRKTVDALLSSPPTSPEQWRQQSLSLSIGVARLYLGYLLVTKELPALYAGSSKSKFQHPNADIAREASLRKMLRESLEANTQLALFLPENPFSDETGLRTLQDYINTLSLHISEICEEAIRLKKCIKSFQETKSKHALTVLSVGLEHIGRHHILFLQPALEWLADETSWP